MTKTLIFVLKRVRYFTLATIQLSDRPIMVSLDVFNKAHYAQPADVVAETAFQKMQVIGAGV